jgi:hypothetical protein
MGSREAVDCPLVSAADCCTITGGADYWAEYVGQRWSHRSHRRDWWDLVVHDPSVPSKQLAALPRKQLNWSMVSVEWAQWTASLSMVHAMEQYHCSFNFSSARLLLAMTGNAAVSNALLSAVSSPLVSIKIILTTAVASSVNPCLMFRGKWNCCFQ